MCVGISPWDKCELYGHADGLVRYTGNDHGGCNATYTLLLARGEDLMICDGRFIRGMCLGGIEVLVWEDFVGKTIF